MGNVKRSIFLQKKKKPIREGRNTNHVKSYRGRGCVENKGASHILKYPSDSNQSLLQMEQPDK